ncbi:transcriptional regulator [Candidatus Parcubacteria bacterium]|nr:transcriptional regulator [Candidatus Parcubacteria bacterium]
MNIKKILKNTGDYKTNLFKRLENSVFSKIYLETAFEEYQKDGDTGPLLLAMRDVANAQGGVGKLAKKTSVNRQHLYDILAGKHNPKLNNWLDILSALGFKIKLERTTA